MKHIVIFYAAYEASNVKMSVIHEKTSNHDTQDRNSYPSCSVEKVFLKISQILQENTCARVSFLITLQASGTVFFCEFCEIYKNTFYTEQLRTTASDKKEKVCPFTLTTQLNFIISFDRGFWSNYLRELPQLNVTTFTWRSLANYNFS